jgi:hypothetical protein
VAQGVSTSNISDSVFCEDFDEYLSRCNESTACRSSFASVCTSELEDSFSEAYKSAFDACLDSVPCNGPAAETPCIAARLAVAPITTAQWILASNFCHACANGAMATGEAGLACDGHVIHGAGRTLASVVLAIGDATATTAAPCVASAAAQYPDDYDNCENTFLNCIADLSPEAPASCK